MPVAGSRMAVVLRNLKVLFTASPTCTYNTPGVGSSCCRAPIMFMFESGLTDRGAALDASHKNAARSQRSRDDYHEPQIYPIGGARAFVSCCFACGCVLEFVVCRVRFACVSCPRLRFEGPTPLLTPVG